MQLAAAVQDGQVADLPAIAGFYSQLAGVLAGFAFASLIAVLAAALTSTRRLGRTLGSVSPLIGAFIALVVSSLNYAIVAGEVPGTVRVAALQVISGAGFSVAGLMLLYSILVLIKGIEVDLSSSVKYLDATARFLHTILTMVVGPLVILLLWGGVRDHTLAKYPDDAGLRGLDILTLVVLVAVVVLSLGLGQMGRIRSPTYKPYVQVVTLIASMVAFLSVSVSMVLISFYANHVVVSDVVIAGAVVTVGAFAVVMSYSSGVLSAASDGGVKVRDPDNQEQGPSCATRVEDPAIDPARSKDGDYSLLILEAVDGRRLARRSIEIFPQGYLSTISIIQGVALSVVTVETVRALTRDGDSLPLLPTLVQALWMLAALMIVFYEYLWFTTMVRWVPTFRDTFVPFVLGVAEIIPALLLDRPIAWWVATSTFTMLGAGAFVNTVTRLHPDMFPGGAEVFDRLKSLLLRLAAVCVVTSLGAATTAVVIAISAKPYWLTVVAGILLVLPSVAMITASERVLNDIYGMYGVPRRPATLSAVLGLRGSPSSQSAGRQNELDESGENLVVLPEESAWRA